MPTPSAKTTHILARCDSLDAGTWRDDSNGSMTDDADAAVASHTYVDPQGDGWHFICRAGPSSSSEIEQMDSKSHEPLSSSSPPSSFRAHSYGGAELHDPVAVLGDAVNLLLGTDGCCSSDDPSSSEKGEADHEDKEDETATDEGCDSPHPEFLPSIDWVSHLGIAVVESDHTCTQPSLEHVDDVQCIHVDAIGVAAGQPFSSSSSYHHDEASPLSWASSSDETPRLFGAEPVDRSRRRYRRCPRVSSSSSSEEESPTTSPHTNLPTQSTVAGEEPPRRSRADDVPPLDYHQQRLMIDAEKARRREDVNAFMTQQQQLGHANQFIGIKMLCNEAHRRHVQQIRRQHEMSMGGSSTAFPLPDSSAAIFAASSASVCPPPIRTTGLHTNSSVPPPVDDSGRQSGPSPSPLSLDGENEHAASSTSSNEGSLRQAPTAIFGLNHDASPSTGAVRQKSILSENSVALAKAAWANVAEIVEESVFCPSAVQSRLSCMGIFRNSIKVSDLICYDDHDDERFAIRLRQQKIINIIRCQAMAGMNSAFLEKPFDFAAEGGVDTSVGFLPIHHPSCDNHHHGAAATSATTGGRQSVFGDDDSDEDFYSPTAFIAMGDF